LRGQTRGNILAPMAHATVRVAYDGPALSDGVMEVRDLAPALLALGKLLEEANQVINGEDAQLSVRVKAGFRTGSFEIDLDLVQSFMERLRDLLAGDTATALTNLLAFVGVAGTVGGGLFALIRRLRGMKPRRATILEDGNVRLELPDGETATVPRPVLDLYRNIKVRKAAAEVVKPLEKDGINAFAVRDTAVGETLRITKEDVPSFAAPEIEDEPLVQREAEAAFTIVSLSFHDDNKWRLSDGQSQVWVRIEDEDFLRQVKENEVAFAKDDVLLCRVRIEQWQTTNGLRTETTVLKVLKHISAMKQLAFPLETERKPAEPDAAPDSTPDTEKKPDPPA
jgi:hypothetical protein